MGWRWVVLTGQQLTPAEKTVFNVLQQRDDWLSRVVATCDLLK